MAWWLLIVGIGVLDRLIRTFFVGAHLQISSVTGLSGYRWAMISSVLVGMAVIATMRWQTQRRPILVASGAMIVVGGINNIVDLFIYRGVIDYWTISHPWGMFWFNAADGMIISGVIYWFIDLLHSDTKIN